MSREIKFRGYSEKDDEWRYGFYVSDNITHEIQTLIDGGMYCSRVDPESVGQFTGLRDVNGVEIYEGDILKQYHFSDAKGKKHYLRHKVVWSYKYDGWLCVNCKSDNENDGSCQLWVYSKTPFTVDGNIYEHPNLLDDSK